MLGVELEESKIIIGKLLNGGAEDGRNLPRNAGRRDGSELFALVCAVMGKGFCGQGIEFAAVDI